MLQECQVRVRNRCSSSVGRTALASVMRASQENPKGPSGGAANNRRGGRRQTGSLPTPHRGHSLSLVLSGNTWLNLKGEQNSVTIRMERKEKNICNDTQTQVPLYTSPLNHQRNKSNFLGGRTGRHPLKQGSELASSTSGQTSTLPSCYDDQEGKSIKCCSYQKQPAQISPGERETRHSEGPTLFQDHKARPEHHSS